MGSMVLSTLMMFTPAAANYLFLVIIGVIFLVVVDPYEWKKRRKKFDRIKRDGKPEKAIHTTDLKKLRVWKDAGLISSQEYREKKRELLDKRKK